MVLGTSSTIVEFPVTLYLNSVLLEVWDRLKTLGHSSIMIVFISVQVTWYDAKNA
jgi:hypothetical protein